MSFKDNGEKNLSEFFFMDFSFKIVIFYKGIYGKQVERKTPNEIRMNKQFLRKLTLENILI